MNKIYKVIMFIIIIMIASTMFFVFFPVEEESPREIDPDLPYQEMKGLNFSLYNEDRSVEWRLSAEQGRESGNILELGQISAGVYCTEEDEVLYNLEALNGNYDEDDEILTIEGPVTINKGDYSFNIGELIWNQNDDMIAGTQGVEVETPSTVINGKKLKANSSLQKVSIEGNEEKNAFLRWENDEKDIE